MVRHPNTRLLAGVGFALAVLSPSVTLAQEPLIPPKGEVVVTATYQWLDSDRHWFSNLTGPLTPLEIDVGTDFHSNSLDLGRVQSMALVLDGDVAITNRLALSGSLAFIAPRYRGAFPEPGPTDDGSFHASVQDMQVGARYMLVAGRWAVTPFTTVTTPVRDYDVQGHAAQGLGLTMLEIGASAGDVLVVNGASKGYLQATYGYTFTESPIEGLSLNRSRASLEAGMFLGRFTLQGLASWRRVHGGLEWSDVGFGHEHFAGHDQSAAAREWRWGAGVSLQLTDATSIEFSYGDFIKGANTHDARTVTVGWSWGFQVFGGQRLGEGFR